MAFSKLKKFGWDFAELVGLSLNDFIVCILIINTFYTLCTIALLVMKYGKVIALVFSLYNHVMRLKERNKGGPDLQEQQATGAQGSAPQ